MKLEVAKKHYVDQKKKKLKKTRSILDNENNATSVKQ
jgi:hypothetical protein